jgi:DNA-binding response OmpR family regulator
MAGDREKTLEAGCDEYETKPVEFAGLLAKIQALLPASL